jgi:16S rRNA (guanine1207-N2)-methyltransferase
MIVGGQDLAALASESLDRFVIAAPPGAIERRHVLAHALRAVKPSGELIALAPKIRGGARLARELTAFGCEVAETARRHQRICRCPRPAAPTGVAEAIEAGALQLVPSLGLWSQPGVFSWDRIDPGSARLIALLPPLKGRGADLGCGVGVLALAALKSSAVSELTLVDLDARAMGAAERNVTDPRARCLQADARTTPLAGLDFVVMNPPFHAGGREQRDLGPAFIAAAGRMLRKGGLCLMVANATLPYEAALARSFAKLRLVDRGGGYKIYEARA